MFFKGINVQDFISDHEQSKDMNSFAFHSCIYVHALNQVWRKTATPRRWRRSTPPQSIQNRHLNKYNFNVAKTTLVDRLGQSRAGARLLTFISADS